MKNGMSTARRWAGRFLSRGPRIVTHPVIPLMIIHDRLGAGRIPALLSSGYVDLL
jgi:hypothetical protein